MRKIVSILLVLVLVFTCLTLAGCGSKNNTADNSDPQGDPYIEEGEPSDSEQSTPVKDSSDEHNIKPDADGFYTYKICNGFAELRIKTNVWDYIDKDNVWDVTRMAADLGFTNPVYSQGKYLNGFESSDGIYKVWIWLENENQVNEYNVFPSNHFEMGYGSNRTSDGPVNLNGESVIIRSNESYLKDCMFAIDTAIYAADIMIGASFDYVILTAAAMEECNGMIDVSSITSALRMFKDNRSPGYYSIP